MTIYRYLFIDYIKVLLFAIISLAAIIFTTRLELVAKFAALGASGTTILWFSWLQMAYILPIVLPLASLFSAILLFQRLSKQNELTALRAGGFSISTILVPILSAAFVLTLINFYFVSEISTLSHFSTRILQKELQSISPISLIEQPKLHLFPNLIIHSTPSSQSTLKNVLLAYWDNKSESIQILSIDSIEKKNEEVFARNIALIHPLSTDRESIAIERTSQSKLTSSDLSILLNQSSWEIKNDYLPLKYLIQHTKDHYKQYRNFKEKNITSKQASYHLNQFHQSISELARRFSLAIGTFTCTLMGAVFAISTGRRRSFRGIITVIALTVLFLISYFIGKRVESNLYFSTLFYFIPHVLICSVSYHALQQINKGKRV